MWLVIIIIIAVVVWVYSSSKQAEREREETRKKRERIAHIKRDYPNAYAEYWGEPVNTTLYYRYREYLNSANLRKADETLSDVEWEELEKRVLKWREEKKEIERKKKADKDWEAAQASFASNIRTIAGEILTAYGNYTYTYSIKTKNGCQLNMKIWQHFLYEACLEKDLDYTYNQMTLNNTNSIPRMQKNGVFPQKDHTKQIYNFISKIAAEKKIIVFFNEHIEGWSIETLSNTYMYIELPKSVNDIDVASDRALKIDTPSGKELLAKETPDCVVVIDAFTTNGQLKKNCEFIFNALQEKHPLLVYISLIKTYDRQEMIAYIERSKNKAEKRAAEEKAKEEERKKREAEEFAAQKKKEEEKARLKRVMQTVVANNKKDWVCLFNDFYCTWFLNSRNLLDQFTLKDFRNGSVDILNHERVLGSVIPQIRQRLIDIFGESDLRLLTLFCIPASTKYKNEERYEEFSRRLCKETGMENAYSHVRITKSVFGEDDHKITTEKKAQPEIEYDIDFFKGRNILLFDDVVTTGDTMLRYKDAMVKMGATVIAGICLGKPRHSISSSLSDTRLAEERARLQGSAKSVLVNNANKWEHLNNNFYYTWLFYYYPTTCDFEASESEWDDRYLVWDFKNDPERGIDPEDHEATLNNVIPQIKQKLIETFGEEYLQFLTLVCLPASTYAKNVARYDEFSNRLCEETGMENAYDHIKIVQDGMSKKDPRNTTGRSIQPVIEFDKDYFKDQYVLLFDDVITRGETMMRYKDAMERMGATVIGGMCLGKTKHERPVQNYIPTNDDPHIFNDSIDFPF